MDPFDLLVAAWEQDEPLARAAAYRAAIAAVDDPMQASAWSPQYLATVRTRAVCGLVSDGEASLAEAEECVETAVAVGEACVSLASLAELYAQLGDHAAALATIRRIPKTCFRSVEHRVWRFRLWDLRVGSAFALGRHGEALEWAGRIVGCMEPEGRGAPESPDLSMEPPRRAVQTLLALADSEVRGAARANALLAEMACRVDLADWFDGDTVAAIRAQVGLPDEPEPVEAGNLTEREAFEAMRLFMAAFWSRNALEPVDVGELLDWTDTGLWDDPDQTNDPAQWPDWQRAVRNARAGRRASY